MSAARGRVLAGIIEAGGGERNGSTAHDGVVSRAGPASSVTLAVRAACFEVRADLVSTGGPCAVFSPTIVSRSDPYSSGLSLVEMVCQFVVVVECVCVVCVCVCVCVVSEGLVKDVAGVETRRRGNVFVLEGRGLSLGPGDFLVRETLRALQQRYSSSLGSSLSYLSFPLLPPFASTLPPIFPEQLSF